MNKNEKIEVTSIISRYIPEDCETILCYILSLDITNYAKRYEIDKVLNDYNVEHTILGAGTNRLGIKFGPYAFKFALDEEGRIDNLHEFKHAPELSKCVVTCYEMRDDAYILVTEYIEVITTQEFTSSSTRISDEEEAVINEMTLNYVIGDIGVTGKNCNNWGKRQTTSGTEYAVLDFAYIYRKENIFVCPYCSNPKKMSIRPYDKGRKLKCITCEQVFNFPDIANLLTYNDRFEVNSGKYNLPRAIKINGNGRTSIDNKLR